MLGIAAATVMLLITDLMTSHRLSKAEIRCSILLYLFGNMDG